MTPSRLPTTGTTVPRDTHLTHPIRPPTPTLFNRDRAFLDPSLPNTHIYKKTTTPAYMRPAIQYLTHEDTIRLRAPDSHVNPLDLYLNDNIINQTLQILHHRSPFTDTRSFLSPNLFKVVKRPNNDTAIPRFHQRNLETLDGPSLDSSYFLIPINITPNHWIFLVRTQDSTKGAATISHDSLLYPLDLTSAQAQAQFKYYDTVLQLDQGFTPVPLQYIPAVA